MPRPIGGIGSFTIGYPVSRDAGKIRQLRRGEANLAHFRGEWFEDRIHHRGVESVRSVQTAVDNIAAREFVFQLSDIPGWASDDAERGRVDSGYREALVEQWPNFGLVHAHTEHRTSRERLHHTAPRSDKLQSIGKSEDSGEAGGDKFANAVADHVARFDAPGDPEFGECVFDGKDCRLREDSLRNFIAGSVVGFSCRMQNRAEIEAKMRLEQSCATVDFLAENALGLVKFA